ncbi:hypothetical protein M758_1G228400 [Ceratodon purpureus]|nr:hypothetical protein M758_1G228400 [Ceratodon purpureus]
MVLAWCAAPWTLRRRLWLPQGRRIGISTRGLAASRLPSTVWHLGPSFCEAVVLEGFIRHQQRANSGLLLCRYVIFQFTSLSAFDGVLASEFGLLMFGRGEGSSGFLVWIVCWIGRCLIICICSKVV